MLSAADELRHEHEPSDYFWRESLYFNFAEPQSELGGWVYFWVTPNKELKSGMLVALYHGPTPDWSATKKAMESPGHVLHGDNGAWVYCYTMEVPELVDADFDDVQLAGLHLRRTSPLETYEIDFRDDIGNEVHLSARFTTRPWDYADGVYETPPWVATNRYHRSWRAQGHATIGDSKYDIDTTGDSDHSWGTRDTEEYARHTFKMWSFQDHKGERSVSAIRRDNGVCFGFVNLGGQLTAIERIENEARYDVDGVQRNISVEIHDVAGNVVTATMERMFATIGHGTEGALWGYEGVGTYTVEGWGDCTGIVSFFWPASFTGEALAADHTIENP